MKQTLLLLTFLLQACTSPQAPSALESRVSEYWNFLVQQDKAAAMRYVAPEGQNDFIRRSEPLFRSWRLKTIEMDSENQALVTVEVERLTPGGASLGFTPVQENWKRSDGLWLASVSVPNQTELLKALTEYGDGEQTAIPLTGTIRFVPAELKIWFLAAKPEGFVLLQNETPDSIEIDRIEFDESIFKLLEAPARIDSQSRAPLRLKYTGEEIKKNLESQVITHFRKAGEAQSMSLDVFYNYFSDGSRGLFGLTKEEADKLPRGVVPRPVIKVPGVEENSQKPPTQPPGGGS